MPTGQLPDPLKPLLNTKAEVIDRFALPVFLSVSACAELALPTVTLPKLRERADKLRTGFAGLTPVPESATTAVDPAAFVAIATEPEFDPAAVGLNTIFKLQLAPGASVPTGQFPDPLKAPLNTKAEVIDRFALPAFLSVST